MVPLALKIVQAFKFIVTNVFPVYDAGKYVRDEIIKRRDEAKKKKAGGG